MLVKVVLAASIVLVGVLPTFDLRYSGLLGPKRHLRALPSATTSTE